MTTGQIGRVTSTQWIGLNCALGLDRILAYPLPAPIRVREARLAGLEPSTLHSSRPPHPPPDGGRGGGSGGRLESAACSVAHRLHSATAMARLSTHSRHSIGKPFTAMHRRHMRTITLRSVLLPRRNKHNSMRSKCDCSVRSLCTCFGLRVGRCN